MNQMPLLTMPSSVGRQKYYYLKMAIFNAPAPDLLILIRYVIVFLTHYIKSLVLPLYDSSVLVSNYESLMRRHAGVMRTSCPLDTITAQIKHEPWERYHATNQN